jgi:hypothetical protein
MEAPKSTATASAAILRNKCLKEWNSLKQTV